MFHMALTLSSIAIEWNCIQSIWLFEVITWVIMFIRIYGQPQLKQFYLEFYSAKEKGLIPVSLMLCVMLLVAMWHDEVMVGQCATCNFSCLFSIFKEKTRGVINSEVTDAPCSTDLPQSGMEVPCKLTFTVPSRRRYCRWQQSTRLRKQWF